MKVKAQGVFRSKLFKPCNITVVSAANIYKSSLILCSQVQSTKELSAKAMPSLLLSVFRSSKKSKDKDRLADLRSPLNVHETGAYVRARGVDKRNSCLQVEGACRIFESYLVEMIVEEGKIRDLMDVEDLLYCWKNLRCPVFIDLVCGFYVEICKDLFFSASEEGSSVQLMMAEN